MFPFSTHKHQGTNSSAEFIRETYCLTGLFCFLLSRFSKIPDFILIISPTAASPGTFTQHPGPWQERNQMYARESQDHFQVLASHRAPLRRETQSPVMNWGVLCTQPLDREAETRLTDVPCLSTFKFLCNSSCFSNIDPPSTRAAVPTEDFLQLQRTLNCLKRAMERNGDPCHWDQKRPCSRDKPSWCQRRDMWRTRFASCRQQRRCAFQRS